MVKVEPRVDAEKLLELLAEQHESDVLEYVSACDLRLRRDIVELATEVGSLAACGGYVVIGVDDRGYPTQLLDPEVTALFDDATVRDKLGRYLPGIDLHVGRHMWSGGTIVVIAVMPHPDGAVVFAADGVFEHGGKARTAFRKGELFVRHGSKSERPSQDDIARLRTEAVEHAQLRMQQLDKTADLVSDIGRLIDKERPTRPDGRLVRIGQPTLIPTACQRLRTALGLLDSVGGPDLPAARRLAQMSQYVFLDQMMGDVFAASAEIAGAAQVAF